uniref:Uncharacterized protein n=1 Tax=Neobodo designis TaxID=312471 RepID=A0A7S1W4K7_NEODS
MLTCSTRVVVAHARRSLLSASSAVLTTRRTIYGDDMHYNYMHDPKIVQTNGVDNFLRTKVEQYDWLQTQQWEGYSDTYLKRAVRYGPHSDTPNGNLKFHHPNEDKICRIAYETYGRSADLLLSLEEDVLQPAFHEKLSRAKEFKEALAKEIDEMYPTVHPTFKLMIDGMLVRRFYQLEDWIEMVQRKRKKTIEKLGPEFFEQQHKMRGIAESYMRNLERVESVFQSNPTHYLGEVCGFNEEEMAFVEQRVMFLRRTKKMGLASSSADLWPT